MSRRRVETSRVYEWIMLAVEYVDCVFLARESVMTVRGKLQALGFERLVHNHIARAGGVFE